MNDAHAGRDPTLEASLDQLRLEVEELRASRARVVAAADAERRRIERALHDGAQQHLVALAVNLQLVRQLADSDPTSAKTLLEQIRNDIREALESVRELAHGIYPPLLLDRGLGDALRAVASTAAIPTRVDASAVARYPPQIEATAYFCCVEALRNATEHAGRQARATIRVLHDHDALVFDVTDDGAGFESTRPRVDANRRDRHQQRPDAGRQLHRQ